MTRRGNKKEAKNSELTLRRNARERERVKNINDAFEGLRDRLPLNRQSKKPSKHETLMGRVFIFVRETFKKFAQKFLDSLFKFEFQIFEELSSIVYGLQGERYKVQGEGVYIVQDGGVYQVQGPENFSEKGRL